MLSWLDDAFGHAATGLVKVALMRFPPHDHCRKELG